MNSKRVILLLLFFAFSLSLFGVNLYFDKVYELKRLTDYPVLLPEGIGFQSKATFNPAAIRVDDEIYLFYRAEDWTGHNSWNGTSSIGLAKSEDGLNFVKESEPIIKPEPPYEIPGGCEDPRIVEIDGLYIMTYTAYDGSQARLCLAYSKDLKEWTKVGPIIKSFRWSKSGAIVPQKINGKYYMYFGDSQIYIATSSDLKNWNVNPHAVLRPRPDKFDARLVEPGPPPLITPEGILLFYNSADYSGIYKVGAALFDLDKPDRLLKRTDKPLLEPELSWEKYGQVPNVVFVEGAVEYNGKLLLYYGAADLYIGVAAIDLAN
ncbi:MAG: glycosidase [Kosmotoga sp.]|uniref:glycoside hydrolase family 130 protein n=1 Tax=Kosmotoga sp. TaxID=1955248 RepID=UPI001DF83627|nr:glycoside hydrolase family 130 protein [Kosmotoga sp.]MBO8167024.1 glycosidase [Kosmotoga sp.]